MVARTLTIEALERWASAGAHWCVLQHGDGRVVVELRQCTGEPVERLHSEDPALIAYLEGVETDSDPPAAAHPGVGVAAAPGSSAVDPSDPREGARREALH